MSISYSPLRVRFDADCFRVDLSDGREIAIPLTWFPRLAQGTQEQREAVRLSQRGLHWEALDEDISIEALLNGLGDQSNSHQTPGAPGRASLLTGVGD